MRKVKKRRSTWWVERALTCPGETWAIGADQALSSILLASYCFAISDFEAIGWERNGATARSTARGGRSSIASDEGLPPPQSDNYALKGDDLPGESTGVLHAQRSGRFPGDTEVASGSPRSPPWWGVCMDTD
jgi:hypothetical protein